MIGSVQYLGRLYQTQKGSEKQTETWPSINGPSINPLSQGWYWFRGLAHEADPFVVQVDKVGQFQWPDGGFQEVRLAKDREGA
jgi:hypothetical protein